MIAARAGTEAEMVVRAEEAEAEVEVNVQEAWSREAAATMTARGTPT